MKHIFSPLLALLLSCQLSSAWTTLPARTDDEPSFVYQPSPTDWRTMNMYSIITDRFMDGDPENNDDHPDATVNPTGADTVHGGDFEGIEQKLDYLHMLGVNAILISPVLRNTWGTYHGYAVQDFNAIDPHWGTLADLRSMVDAAHAKGIYVFIDIVCNHTDNFVTYDVGMSPPYNPAGYTKLWRTDIGGRRPADPFNDLSKFHNFGELDWGNNSSIIPGDYPGLDDLKTEDAQIRADMITIYSALIDATDCDGFRMDTARHVDMGFWETFLPGIYDHAETLGKSNFMVFAEAPVGGDIEQGAYTATNRFNSLYQFSLNGSTKEVFVDDLDTGKLGYHFRDGQATNYHVDVREQLIKFLDHHDSYRFMSSTYLNGDTNRLNLALGYLYTSMQIPYLYYGTEQAFRGINDGNNHNAREDMFDGGFEQGASLGDNFNSTHEIYQWVRKLNLLRNAYPALSQGDFTERWSTWCPYYEGDCANDGGPGLYVFTRKLGADEVIVAFNTANTTKEAYDSTQVWLPDGSGGYYSIEGPETSYSVNTVLVNLLDTNETITVGQNVAPNHCVRFQVPAKSMKIFYPASGVQALAPTITSCMPGHGSMNQPLTNAVTIQFDKAMNTSSTEAAFSLIPSTSGSFAWAASNTELTFTPNQLLPLQPYTIRISAAALSAESTLLGAGFVSEFSTEYQVYIDSVHITGSTIQFNWLNQTGFTYYIERATQLNPHNFSSLTPGGVLTNTYSDPMPSSPNTFFYRVKGQ